eukprot:g7298.t1
MENPDILHQANQSPRFREGLKRQGLEWIEVETETDPTYKLKLLTDVFLERKRITVELETAADAKKRFNAYIDKLNDEEQNFIRHETRRQNAAERCRNAHRARKQKIARVEKEGEEAVYTFVDFRKAYDSIDWVKMPLILRKLGMPAHIVKVVQATNEGAKFRLKLGGDKLSGSIKQRSGIRQGSSLSPLEFVLLLGFAMECFAETMERKGWREEKAARFSLTWLGFVDDLVIKNKRAEDVEGALRELMAACRFIGLDVNVGTTELMTFGLCPTQCDNEDAEKERCYQHGNEDELGWLVDYDGAHLVPEWKEKVKGKEWKEEGRPTHIIVWDSGECSLVRYTEKGWATTEDGKKIRLVRLGQKQFVLQHRNKFICSRCGDVLPDGKALKFHQATGFCRPVKTTAQKRQLRVGRYLEEKAKVNARKKLVAPIDLQTYNGEKINTAAAFKYLGTQVSNAATTSAEIARRTGVARTTVGTLKDLWRDGAVPRHLKAEIYGALVTSVALYKYNAECWVIPEADWKVLRAFQMATLKVVTGEDKRRWHAQHTQRRSQENEETEETQDQEEAEEEEEENEEQEWVGRRALCQASGIVDIETLVREKRVAWAAHAARDHSGEGVYEWIENEVRRKTTWGRQLRADLEVYGLELENLEDSDAASLREMMQSKREVEAAKRAKGKKGRKAKKGTNSAKTDDMREQQRKRIAQKKWEDARELFSRINNQKWARAPGAGVDIWQLANCEEVKFKVSLDEFEENTGRDYKEREQESFLKSQRRMARDNSNADKLRDAAERRAQKVQECFDMAARREEEKVNNILDRRARNEHYSSKKCIDRMRERDEEKQQTLLKKQLADEEAEKDRQMRYDRIAAAKMGRAEEFQNTLSEKMRKSAEHRATMNQQLKEINDRKNLQMKHRQHHALRMERQRQYYNERRADDLTIAQVGHVLQEELRAAVRRQRQEWEKKKQVHELKQKDADRDLKSLDGPGPGRYEPEAPKPNVGWTMPKYVNPEVRKPGPGPDTYTIERNLKVGSVKWHRPRDLAASVERKQLETEEELYGSVDTRSKKAKRESALAVSPRPKFIGPGPANYHTPPPRKYRGIEDVMSDFDQLCNTYATRLNPSPRQKKAGAKPDNLITMPIEGMKAHGAEQEAEGPAEAEPPAAVEAPTASEVPVDVVAANADAAAPAAEEAVAEVEDTGDDHNISQVLELDEVIDNSGEQVQADSVREIAVEDVA